jgi:hypothetical protein
MEHFVTLFDHNFIPQGLALLESLRRTSRAPFRLWIVCLDGETYDMLAAIDLPDAALLKLHECETAALRETRSNRSYGEYCWTLASHSFSFVFDRAPDVQRLTYLDADLYFLADPTTVLREFAETGKHVLITEHAYAPEWEHFSRTAGAYCVQFVTFCRSPAALALLAHWQAQTREQCSSDPRPGGFGDQAYLDEWPIRWASIVHVLEHRYRTLAPWNADYAASLPASESAVFFHFHGLRLLGARWIQQAVGYPVRQPATRQIYRQYQEDLHHAVIRLRLVLPGYRPRQSPRSWLGWAKLGWHWVRRRATIRRIRI